MDGGNSFARSVSGWMIWGWGWGWMDGWMEEEERSRQQMTAGLAGGEIPRRRPTGLRARGGPRAAAAAAPGRPQNGSRVIYLDDVTKRMNEYVPAPP